MVYLIGWPHQTFVNGTLGDIAPKVRNVDIRRQAVTIVGKVFGVREGEEVKRSTLYDESFSHGFRKGLI
ncbi:MAG: hypothetical protein AB2L11_13830 [Syntrophobacteraceae bacterium]